MKAPISKPTEAFGLAVAKIYGDMPARPVHLSYKTEFSDPGFAVGKATLKKQNLILDLGESEITFPLFSVIPNDRDDCPAIVNLGFESCVPNKYLPAEEIIDRGYAIFHISIGDISDNSGNFKSGISSVIARSRRKKSSPGKAAVWAWAAARVVEHILGLNTVDNKNILLSGHGITAISALILAGCDENVGFVIANDPFAPFGGLSASAIATQMPHLFCPAYSDEPTDNFIKPLLLNCVDKKIMIRSAADKPFFNAGAERDIIADAGRYGCEIYYQLRGGGEYFSREDWNNYLDYIDEKISTKP